MSYLTHLRDKVRYSPLPRIFIDGLDKLGIQIHLIYLIREGITGGVARPQLDGLEGYEVGFLGAEDMTEMAQIPYRPVRYEELQICPIQGINSIFQPLMTRFPLGWLNRTSHILYSIFS